MGVRIGRASSVHRLRSYGVKAQILARLADGHDDRLPEMAADLVRHHVAVIATPLSTQAAIAVPT